MLTLSALFLLPVILYLVDSIENTSKIFNIYLILTGVVLIVFIILNFTERRLYKSVKFIRIQRVRVFNLPIFWAGLLFIPTIIKYYDTLSNIFLIYLALLSLFLITSIKIRMIKISR